MPILLVTHSLDGRLTALSIFASWLATALFGALLLWRIRIVIRGDAPLGWAESGILWGAPRFHPGRFRAGLSGVAARRLSEDLAWSIALCSASLFALLGVIEQPSWGRVAASGVLVLLTNLNRATTGYACVLGTILIAAWFALGRAGPDRRRWALPVLLAGMVPLVAGCAVDLAKFNLFFGVPPSEQLIYKAYGFSRINGGHYFAVRFLPSTLQTYLSPGNLRLTSVFPYLTLPDIPTQPIAHTTLFTRAPTASVPASMPLLFGAGLWGVIATFEPGRPAVVRSIRILLVAAAVSAGSVMIFGWVLERFVGDFMPLLILASMIGMVDIWRRLEGRQPTVHFLAPAVVLVVGLFEFVAMMGIAATPVANWTQTQAGNYVHAERTVSDLTGHPLSHDVVRGSGFPAAAPMGELFVMGRCDRLFIAVQAVPKVFYLPPAIWLQVEHAPHTPICHSLLAAATGAPPPITSVPPRQVVPPQQKGVRRHGVTPSW